MGSTAEEESKEYLLKLLIEGVKPGDIEYRAGANKYKTLGDMTSLNIQPGQTHVIRLKKKQEGGGGGMSCISNCFSKLQEATSSLCASKCCSNLCSQKSWFKPTQKKCTDAEIARMANAIKQLENQVTRLEKSQFGSDGGDVSAGRASPKSKSPPRSKPGSPSTSKTDVRCDVKQVTGPVEDILKQDGVCVCPEEPARKRSLYCINMKPDKTEKSKIPKYSRPDKSRSASPKKTKPEGKICPPPKVCVSPKKEKTPKASKDLYKVNMKVKGKNKNCRCPCPCPKPRSKSPQKREKSPKREKSKSPKRKKSKSPKRKKSKSPSKASNEECKIPALLMVSDK